MCKWIAIYANERSGWGSDPDSQIWKTKTLSGIRHAEREDKTGAKW